MPNNLGATLSKIEKLASNLNEAANEANAIVQRVEESLRRWGVGISCQVPLNTLCDECGNEFAKEFFCFERIAGKYRLAVGEEACVEMPGSRKVTPWPSVDRETKLQAFAVLPTLLEEVFKRLAEDTEEAKATVAKVKTTLTTL